MKMVTVCTINLEKNLHINTYTKNIKHNSFLLPGGGGGGIVWYHTP